MTTLTRAPDLSQFVIPMDVWTAPFWKAAARKELHLPRCASCGAYRWPPGPFCPYCRAQACDWVPAGQARIYSYTILRQKPRGDNEAVGHIAPALVEFPQSGGVRLMAAIVDTPLDAIRVGVELHLCWAPVGNTHVPQFTVR